MTTPPIPDVFAFVEVPQLVGSRDGALRVRRGHDRAYPLQPLTALRGGFELAINDELTLKSQVYGYGADREWKNSEVSAFNAANDLVDRERFYVAHDQKLVGNVTDLTWDTRVAGMANRLVATVAASDLNFNRPGAANFPHDFVPVFGFDPGTYGLLTTQTQTANINNESLAFEDRLKITQTFALIGGLRTERAAIERGQQRSNDARGRCLRP